MQDVRVLKYNNAITIDDETTSTTGSTTIDDICESYGLTADNVNSSEHHGQSNIVVPLSSLQESMNDIKTVSMTLNLKDVNFLKILGEGQFGQVWLATATNADQKKVTAAPMAVKVLSKYSMVESGDTSIVTNLIREVEVLREIHRELDVHPCLVQMIEAIQDDNLTYIFQEFCSGGELFTLLHDDAIAVRTIPNAVQFYAACIADTLHYLHQHGIIYRDLKPENIMIRPTNGYPVLVDFGYAKRMKNPRIGPHRSSFIATASGVDVETPKIHGREIKVIDLIDFFENNNDQIIEQCTEHTRSSVVKFQDNTMIRSKFECSKASERFSCLHRLNIRVSTTNWYTSKDDFSYSSNSTFHHDNDFNDSCYLDAEQNEEKCYSMVGTPKYVAPEIILGGGYDYRVDLWALGVVTYEMLARYNPMIGPNDSDNSIDVAELYRCITEEDYVPLPNDISAKDSHAADLIDVLLQRNPNERIKSSSDVLQHSWFSGIDFYELRQQSVRAPWMPFQDSHSNNLDTKHFDDWADIANDPDKCVFKSSYPILKKKEIALFANETAFRRQ